MLQISCHNTRLCVKSLLSKTRAKHKMQKTGRQARNCSIPEEDETAVATCGHLCKITQGLQQWLKKMADPSSWVRHRPPDRVGGAVGISGRPESPYDDVDLVRRITAAYRKTAEISLKLSKSM